MKRLAVTAVLALAGAMAFIVFGTFALLGTGAEDSAAAQPGPGSVCTVTVDGAGLTLTGVQLGNAETIMRVAMESGAGERGALVGIATAMQESTLNADLDEAASDRDSAGLFQQRRPWGPLADRMDPTKSSRMFFTGGQGGQNGLLDIAGWEAMPVTRAAQAVQVSAFPDAYARWEPLARALVDGAQSACADGSGTVPAGEWRAPLTRGSYTITSDYGPRACNSCTTFHKGVDLGAPTGTPVYASAAGRVIFAGWMGTYGQMVEIDHGGGVSTRHAHLSKIIARVGQDVQGGTVIAEVGNTGNSFGSHLHYETHINGTHVDPIPFLAQKGVTL